MTRKEFDQAIDAIHQGHISRQPSRAEAVEEAQCASRVLAAMCLVMRELRDIPEEQTWEPTSAQIVAFINPGPGADVSIPDTIALAQLPRVHFIKESSRDLARVSRLIFEIDRAGHACYFTTMQMLLATLELGGSGATMPPPAAEIARHIIDAFVAKDHERAAALQLQFAQFPSKWMHRGLAPVMKAAMNLIGVPVGDPYPPYASLSADEIDALAAVLRASVLASRFSATAAA